MASALGVLLEDEEGSQDGAEVEFALEGADDLLRTVATVIAMSKSITDLAAVTFAARFYAAIASAQSVATAVEQARTAMQMASLEDSHLPEIRTREDVDPTSLVLVTPVS